MLCRLILQNVLKSSNFFKNLNILSKSKFHENIPFSPLLVAGGLVSIYMSYRCLKKQNGIRHTSGDAKNTGSSREQRFLKFASIKYDGQMYMTPRDFLESVVEPNDCTYQKRRILNSMDVDRMKENTPPLSKGSSQLFRTLGDKGIISYAEYLILLSVLMKSRTALQIALNMIDTDRNGWINKNEFLTICSLLSGTHRKPHTLTESTRIGNDNLESTIKKDKDEAQTNSIETTLNIHLFSENKKLRLKDFEEFMLDLQTEVLEVEFNKCSKGLPTISEVDFATILLKHTYSDDYNIYYSRLLDRIKESKRIKFDEFFNFCQFLYNLEDCMVAVGIYILADKPISKEEFYRVAKISTGISLSEHIVNTVFAIFDKNGDGLISFYEFITVMEDRVKRRFKFFKKKEVWKTFKNCTTREMKKPV